jgi:hypothetical protein
MHQWVDSTRTENRQLNRAEAGLLVLAYHSSSRAATRCHTSTPVVLTCGDCSRVSRAWSSWSHPLLTSLRTLCILSHGGIHITSMPVSLQHVCLATTSVQTIVLVDFPSVFLRPAC